jgi:mycothiol synthase
MNKEIRTIDLLTTPEIAGLQLRHFAGEADYPAMVTLLNRCSEADALDYVTTLDGLKFDYSHLINSDPAQDMIMAEVNGQLVGYGRVYWHQEAEGPWVYGHVGRIDPRWRRQGLGRAILDYNQQRLRAIAAGHKPTGPLHFAADVSNDAAETGTLALLQQDGYEPIRYFFKMVRPDLDHIPDLPLPAGLEIRPALPEHYAAIVAANLEAFQDHWGITANPEEELTVEMLTSSPVFDPTIWQVAWDGNEIAGMVLNYIDRNENEKYGRQWGYTEEICVRRPWRQRGLAKALIARSLQVLKERGMSQTALFVDADNISGALRLYEGMGYRVVRRSSQYRKPLN